MLQSFSMALKGHQQRHIQVVGNTVHKKIVGAAIFKGNAEVTAYISVLVYPSSAQNNDDAPPHSRDATPHGVLEQPYDGSGRYTFPTKARQVIIVLYGPNISGAPRSETCTFQAAIQHQNRTICCSNIRTTAMGNIGIEEQDRSF